MGFFPPFDDVADDEIGDDDVDNYEIGDIVCKLLLFVHCAPAKPPPKVLGVWPCGIWPGSQVSRSRLLWWWWWWWCEFPCSCITILIAGIATFLLSTTPTINHDC